MKKIVSVKPKQYLQQGMRYCGGYTIKAILSAYNLGDGRHPKEYLPSLKKSFGFTTPKMIQKVLLQYKLNAPMKRVNNVSDAKKLEIIKRELNKNRPVILLIGNGYSPKGRYSALRMQCISHWISIWGYDDNNKVFYIYDSYRDKNYYDEIPIGNIKRSYAQVLRDWKGPLMLRKINFLYMPIGNMKPKTELRGIKPS